MMLSFEEIVKRANTPFVLAIRRIPQVETFPAEVSVEGWEVEGNNSADKGMSCKRVGKCGNDKSSVFVIYTRVHALHKIHFV